MLSDELEEQELWWLLKKVLDEWSACVTDDEAHEFTRTIKFLEGMRDKLRSKIDKAISLRTLPQADGQKFREAMDCELLRTIRKERETDGN